MGLVYDDQDIHLLNMTITQVMVNAVDKGTPFTWAHHITLLLQNQNTVWEVLADWSSQPPFRGVLTDTN